MTLSIVMPSMRPHKALAVIYDMLHQTLVPNNILIVDNSSRIDFDKIPSHNGCQIKVLQFGKNIGTNPAWNMAWDFTTKFVGFVADDLRLDKDLFRKLIKLFEDEKVGASCCTLIDSLPLPLSNPNNLSCRSMNRGKGQCGVVIFRRSTLKKIPKIPPQFKIFYGDTWLGFWVRKKLGLKWVRLNTSFVYHKPGPNNVSESLRYDRVLRKEREYWNSLAL